MEDPTHIMEGEEPPDTSKELGLEGQEQSEDAAAELKPPPQQAPEDNVSS